MKKIHLKVVLGVIALIVCILVARTSGVGELLDLDNVRNTILGFGVYTPIVYIFFYILASLLFIPATPLTLAGGAVFGPVYGTLYTVVGATLGALCAFLLARFIGGGFLDKSKGGMGAKLSEYDKKLTSNGFATVLFLRLVPLFPFNGLNFALGVTGVRLRDYALGTFLGIIPGTFVYVFFGDSLVSLSVTKILIAAAGIIALALLGRNISKRYNKANHE